nr:hypothetical protein [Tanacetum cinerariifolium]
MDRRSLIMELRYKVDSSDWPDVLTYFCREAADENRNIATKLNRLCEEMLIIYEKRRNLVDELRSIRGIVVVQKATCVVKVMLSDELRENVRMRDAYIEEFQRLQMYGSSDEVTESIKILKSMQVDDMEKASRLIFMARDIQNRVYEKYNFITKLRR